MAIIFKNLMEKLGFKQYYVQGGDWGSIIASSMAVLCPEKLLGMHNNMPISQTTISKIKLIISSVFPKLFLKDGEDVQYFDVKKNQAFWATEDAYSRIQATKPDTIGKFFPI